LVVISQNLVNNDRGDPDLCVVDLFSDPGTTPAEK
jgi:hypothetical protein